MQLDRQSSYLIQDMPISFVFSHKDLGILIDNILKFHSHIRKLVCFVNSLTNNIILSAVCRKADFILNIYVSHIIPLLEYGSCLWNTSYLGDSRVL